MPQFFFYKLTSDDGGAPCVERGLLSLAICKPMIRCSAKVGDVIFGFAADSVDRGNRLIYIAKVTTKLPNGEYYRDAAYSNRGDCIYAWRGGTYVFRRAGRFHGPEHLAHDLGTPPDYERGAVLLSRDFRYFGAAPAGSYKDRYPALARAVGCQKQGHRVHLSEKLLAELKQLQDETWQRYPRRKVLGQPTHAPRLGVSHRGGGCGVVAHRAERC